MLRYKKHIISALQTETFDRLDLMYDKRFVSQTTSAGATINKTPVYYDAVKALLGFTPCAYATIEQCTTQSGCEGAGGNWSGELCQHTEVSVLTQEPAEKPKNLRILQNP